MLPFKLSRTLLTLCVIIATSTLAACSSKSAIKTPQVQAPAVQKEATKIVCEAPPPSPPVQPAIVKQACQCDCESKNVSEVPIAPVPPKKIEAPSQAIADFSLLTPSSWALIDGFNDYNLTQAWPAWQHSCSALKSKPAWQQACDQAHLLNAKTAGTPSASSIRSYFISNFNVYKTSNTNGSDTGLITGYYQPSLKGSRTQSAQYQHPLYLAPRDLITVDLSSQYAELKHKRIRGRLAGNKLVPYYSRAEIATQPSPVRDAAFLYIDDIIDVFFLQIQGSGVVELDTGERIHVGYANQNGHAYRSIGRELIKKKQLKASQASMAGIKNWARNHPAQLRSLLNSNPSFVFFRELPKGLPGPLGALGVPLLAEQAIAVDKKHIPMGAPVFLSTTEPNSTKPLKKLMMAQDTGGAIKGGVRADFYWGSGDNAGKRAGSMKQSGKLWVLLPKGYPLPNNQ